MTIVLKGTAMIKTGGCLCGETRYQITAEPFRSSVCHCRYCQLRTGSAFGVSIYFQDDEVTLLSGKLDHFSYATESGHNVKNERCSICEANFCEIIAPEEHATHPDYAPLKQDEERLSGQKNNDLTNT